MFIDIFCIKYESMTYDPSERNFDDFLWFPLKKMEDI